jgi:hypothetical protein
MNALEEIIRDMKDGKIKDPEELDHRLKQINLTDEEFAEALSDLFERLGRPRTPHSDMHEGFDGFACSREEITFADPDIQSIIDGYKDRPRIHQWNNPKASAFVMMKENPDAEPIEAINLNAREGRNTWDEYHDILHELVHSTGTIDRLARPWVTDVVKEHRQPSFREYHLEEVVAEMGAKMLLEAVGMLTPDMEHQCDNYLSSYAFGFLRIEGMSELQVKQMAFPYARAAAEYILGRPLSPGVAARHARHRRYFTQTELDFARHWRKTREMRYRGGESKKAA